MNPEVFFSRGRQLRLSLARDFRYSWGDWIGGPVCVFAGFYFFRTVGAFRDYDVNTPFMIIEGVMAFVALYLSWPEMRGLTARFYKNLARDRAAAWDARILFLLLMTAYLELAAVLGAYLDLGGMGLVEHYRFHPPFFVLPVYALAAVMWCTVVFQFPLDETRVGVTLAFAVFPIVPFNLLLPSWAHNVIHNGAHTMRGAPLWLEWILVAVLLGLSGVLFSQARRMWLHPYQGD